MTSRRRHCHRSPPSPAAGPLEDDDLLSEILLRLPPQLSSLPRASAVCKHWRLLVSDPAFSCRFRIHHRRSPPVLGFFDDDHGRSFLPTLEAPNRVPPGRFSSQSLDSDRSTLLCLGCRHGLVLLFDLTFFSFLVWDPVTGQQHHLARPPGFDPDGWAVNGAVLRAGPDVQHFQVVLVVAGDDDKQQRRVFACVYSSETAGWGNVTSTSIERQWCWFFSHKYCFSVVRKDGGGLGFLVVEDLTAQLWKWKTNFDGVASWELERTIDLNKLLSPYLDKEDHIMMIRFAEDNNLLVLHTDFSLFTGQLQSLQFKKLSGNNNLSHHHPFESVYTVVLSDMLQNPQLPSHIHI
ncbi:hypothetical protein VPH35_108804 [Triticum aestivum]